MSSNIAQASLSFALNNYEKTYNLLKNENKSKPKVLSMLGTICFFTGRFEEALQIFNRLFIQKDIYLSELGCSIEDYYSFGREIHKTLMSLDIDKLPLNIDYTYKQSIENANGEYKELNYINELIKNSDKPDGKIEMDNFVLQVHNDIESYNNLKREKAYVHLAEINFLNKDFKKAFECYYNAIKLEPSKALYYGYAAQMLLRSGDTQSILLMPLFTRRAIDLDPENARWHMLHGCACNHLSKKVNKNFVYHAEFALKNALKYCREDQIALRRDINNLIEGINRLN